MKIIIVGAGLAGLTCAKVLRERGAEVAVFEASDGVGGRVRTDEQDGFLLDRGFQVYFTSYPVAGRHLDLPEESAGEVCIYYEIDRLGSGKKILLNAEDGAFVNNAVEMSNISEKYAPPERHLLYAVGLTGMDLPDEDLYRRGIEDLSRWYPGADFRPLALRRIPYGQFAQPPGIHSRLPENMTRKQGLVLAGEYTEDSSINGSMLSGEKAARAVIA
jgi:hypothetical protein